MRSVWLIYGGLTLAAVLALAAAGLPAWVALNHGMTAVSTGGFAVTDDSFNSAPPAAQVAAAAAMVAGAVSFRVHGLLLVRRRWAAAFRDAQARLLVALLALGAAGLWVAGAGGWGFGTAAFQWVSALCTGGLHSATVGDAGAGTLAALSVAMLVGGSVGSTVGGLKLRRILTLIGALVGRVPPGGDPGQAKRLLAAFAATYAVGGGALWWVVGEGFRPAAVWFEAASALGTTGLSAGVTGPDLPAPAKLVLIALMWLGRLEILAAVALAGRLLRARGGSP